LYVITLEDGGLTTGLNYLHGLKHVNWFSHHLHQWKRFFCWLEHSFHTNKGIPLKIMFLCQ